LIGHFDHSYSCRAYWRSRIRAMPTTRRMLKNQRKHGRVTPEKQDPPRRCGLPEQRGLGVKSIDFADAPGALL
jgi:hypothetical protein